MVSGSDILSYRGDVALGLNSEGIEHYGEFDTKQLNASMFNLAYLNMQKNKAVWEQKIKDRDDGMKLISDGKLQINDVLPKDREILMKKIQEVKDVYFKNGGDVKSDPRTWLDLNSKLADFNNGNTVAQSKLVTYKTGVAEAAKEKNPIIKKAMVDHWANQLNKKDLHEPFDPYQQTLDYDIKKTLPGVSLKTATTRDGDNDVTETTTDVKKSIEDYVLAYVANDKGETQPNIDAHFDDFFGQNGLRSPETVAQDVAIVNDKLKKIAALEGYDVTGKYMEGDGFTGPLPDGVKALPKYLQPIKVQMGENGQVGVSERKDMSMAKVNLALNYKRDKASKLNPDYAALDKTKAQTEKEKKLGDAALIKARAYQTQQLANAGYKRAQTKALNAKTEETTRVDNPFNEIPTLVQVVPGSKEMFIEKKDLTPAIINIAGGVGKDKKPLSLPTKVLKFKRGSQNIEGWYFRPVKDKYYTADGVNYSKTEIAKLAFKKGKSYDEMLTELIDKKIIYQDGEVYTEQGKGTRLSTLQSAKALNNPLVSKGDENVIVDDESDNSPEED